VRFSDATWTVRATGGSAEVPAGARDRDLPAVVPGCVHTDLVRAGVIEHPDVGFAERDATWIGRTDWRYACRIDAPDDGTAHTRLDLACDGLDTIAAVALNGVEIGRAANMHHPHRFDVREHVRPGPNDLAIAFRGPLAYAEEQERRLGTRPVNGEWGPYAYVRKAACNFGWDWGPCVPTAGVWRDGRLHAWSVARVRGVRPLVVRADARRAVVEVVTDVERDGVTDPPLHVRAVLREPSGAVHAVTATIEPGAARAAMRIAVNDPPLWWPIGLGSQPLCDVEVEVRRDGTVLDRWRGRVGLRSVRLRTAPDAGGAGFALEINGGPVFCRGANWIPDTLFPAEMTADRYHRRIGQAIDAHANMLRVWGGGLYEDDVFYETCDERGVMVWQDFMLACATYPEDPPYPALIEAEALHQVTRLARHPSIVLWCGGNENVLAYESWGWKEEMEPGQTWGRRYFLGLLPRVVADLDPTRPFRPDSPWSGTGRHPNDPDHGDRHTWDARLEEHRTIVPRFASEFGHQAPAAYATLVRAAGPEALDPTTAASRHRQRAWGGHEQQYAPLDEWFGASPTPDAWHARAQLLQARATSIAIEWLRASRPRCMGALVWQLNDCWSGHTWSLIDGDGRRKPAWYAFRRACAPRLLTIQPGGDGVRLHAVNDGVEAWRADVHARRVRFDGAVRAEANIPIDVAPDAATMVADLTDALGPPGTAGAELLVADAGDLRATWFFARDRELSMPSPGFTAEITSRAGVVELTLTAETLLRDVMLAADRVDPAAEVDDHLITLLPREQHRFTISTSRALDPAVLTAPPVLQCRA
jgi:beta-mannosidase